MANSKFPAYEWKGQGQINDDMNRPTSVLFLQQKKMTSRQTTCARTLIHNMYTFIKKKKSTNLALSINDQSQHWLN